MEVGRLESLMGLKVKELLKEVEKKHESTRTRAIIKFIDDKDSAIRDVIDNIPEDAELLSTSATEFLRDLCVDAASLKFYKPKSIAIGGSFLINTVYTDALDIFIRLP